ncbi:hypothetical protein MMC22_003124 [Lobaria immixta]|nr:hypothetical protein [Lobaria immixta]
MNFNDCPIPLSPSNQQSDGFSAEFEPFLEHESKLQHRWQSTRKSSCPWTLFFNLGLFALSIVMLLAAVYTRFFGLPVNGRTASESIIGLSRYETLRFNDSTLSIYRGPPSPKGDEAWNQLINVSPFNLGAHKLREIGAPSDSAMLSREAGGGYLANLAVFHQLHCLKNLWQHTYFEYYETRNPLFSESAKELHRHLDHCADLLRQALMCNGDTSVITFKWTDDHKLPRPNYGLPRRCRSYEQILQWGLSHQATLSDQMEDSLEKYPSHSQTG